MVNKITNPPSQIGVIDKINEVIDAIPTNFLTNTDYANGSTAGVIKTASANGCGTSGNGFLYATTNTYTNYSSAGNNIFISKGTLENVLTGKGFITGITSSDVTTALGYTPQVELTSGTNIKTINGNSILGSGNLTVETDISGKADTDLSNVANTAGFRKLVEIYNNGSDWYKVYREYDPSTGTYIGLWCEQGGHPAIGSTTKSSITLLREMADTNYSIQLTGINGTWNIRYNTRTTTDFTVPSGCWDWIVRGYAKEG